MSPRRAWVCLFWGLLVTGNAAFSASDRGLVSGDPKSLVVGREELAAEFSIASGDYQPSGAYVAVYFRPEVLEPDELKEGELLGVLATVNVHRDPAEARRSFDENRTAESIRESMGEPGSGRELIGVETLACEIDGADEGLLFRLEYKLAGEHVVEYRYRLLLANAVTNLVINGRTGGEGVEPPALAGQARGIAERQLAKLADSQQ